jgi:acyl-CoA oxidase
MEACRKLCGGHGFLASAGFAEIQMSFLPFCTLEGTKEVLYQQTGKYLVKALSAKAKGPLHANIEYLKQESNTCVDVNEEQSIHTMIRQLLAAMAMRSKALVVAAAASIASNQRDIGLKLEDAFTACAVELCEAAESHAELLIATSFANAVDALKGDPSIDLSAEEKQVLEQLVLLSISKRISEGFGSFIVTNSISTTSFSVIQGTVRRLCKDLAPHALNLAEAYQLSDKRLDSTLGRSDGDVYTAIVEKASQEPLNNGAAEEGQKYLLGMLHRRKRGELEIAVSKKGNRKVTSKL